MSATVTVRRRIPGLQPAALALLVVEAQLLDAVTWILAVRRDGIAGEANPVAAALYHAAGTDAVLALKLGAAVLLGWLAFRLAGRWWALVPAALGIAGALTNVIALR